MGSPRYFLPIASACKEAYDQGIPVVAAAGNNYCGTFFPATHDYVISVAAVQDSDAGILHCLFSNLWPTTDISAPGNDILSLEPKGKYCLGDGTSAAAPHVTGVLALGVDILKKKRIPVSAGNLEALLKSTSRRLVDLPRADTLAGQYDPQRAFLKDSHLISGWLFGAGLVQADKFLEELYQKL